MSLVLNKGGPNPKKDGDEEGKKEEAGGSEGNVEAEAEAS
jgi:hypothetical protein